MYPRLARVRRVGGGARRAERFRRRRRTARAVPRRRQTRPTRAAALRRGRIHCLHQDLSAKARSPAARCSRSAGRRRIHGGELVLVESSPRAQSAARCCASAGDLVSSRRASARPVVPAITAGRAPWVSRVRPGARTALGVISTRALTRGQAGAAGRGHSACWISPFRRGRAHPRRALVLPARRGAPATARADHAGAGTGKTTVLTRRIAHLIASKRARPEEILALTFTEKAAAEMSERVDQLIPYGYAETWIGTFHAFGDRVLREGALEAGLNPEFRVLARPEQIIFLRERIFRLPLERFRPLGDPTHLAALITWSARQGEDVSPAQSARGRPPGGGGSPGGGRRARPGRVAAFYRLSAVSPSPASRRRRPDPPCALAAARQRGALSALRAATHVLVDECQTHPPAGVGAFGRRGPGPHHGGGRRRPAITLARGRLREPAGVPALSGRARGGLNENHGRRRGSWTRLPAISYNNHPVGGRGHRQRLRSARARVPPGAPALRHGVAEATARRSSARACRRVNGRATRYARARNRDAPPFLRALTARHANRFSGIRASTRARRCGS